MLVTDTVINNMTIEDVFKVFDDRTVELRGLLTKGTISTWEYEARMQDLMAEESRAIYLFQKEKGVVQ